MENRDPFEAIDSIRPLAGSDEISTGSILQNSDGGWLSFVAIDIIQLSSLGPAIQNIFLQLQKKQCGLVLI